MLRMLSQKELSDATGNSQDTVERGRAVGKGLLLRATLHAGQEVIDTADPMLRKCYVFTSRTRSALLAES